MKRDLCLLIPVLAFYVGAVTFNLSNYYPVSGDEAIIMSTSHKLATQGVPGSDLVTGLHGAERALFLNLPVHNVIQAITFALFGTGIWQARLPSVAASVAVLGLTWWFAWRSFGPVVAATTVVLLVCWRSNLIGSDPRPPLLALGQTARYDLVVVALFWTTIVLLHRSLERPARSTALATGVVAGLATLTQFYGVAAILTVTVAYAVRWRASIVRESAPCWAAAGWLAIIVPYVAFLYANADAFLAQASLQGARVRMFDPAFWVTNLFNERLRYATVTEPTIGGIAPTWALSPWMLWLGAVPGVAALITRSTPLLAFVVPFAVLALADQTKATLYASLLVPGACLAFACAIARVLRPTVPRAARIGAIIVLGVLAVESYRGYEFALRAGAQASPYVDVGRRIASYMTDDRPALGPWRWWWAMQPRPYFGVNGLWWHAERLAPGGTYASLHDEAQEKRAAYLVVDGDFIADLSRTTEIYRAATERYLGVCTALAGTVDDSTYGRIEIRRIATGCTVR